MPIGIFDVAVYHSVGPVWVITWAPFRSYSALLSLSCTINTYGYLLLCFSLSISIGRWRHKASIIKTKIYINYKE